MAIDKQTSTELFYKANQQIKHKKRIETKELIQWVSNVIYGNWICKIARRKRI